MASIDHKFLGFHKGASITIRSGFWKAVGAGAVAVGAVVVLAGPIPLNYLGIVAVVPAYWCFLEAAKVLPADLGQAAGTARKATLTDLKKAGMVK